MRAILLAAGYGRRLRPITETVPKCLVTVQGRPLLDIWFELLMTAGVTKILINSHYLADQVEEHIQNSVYSPQISLVYEPTLRGTGGTLFENLGFYKGADGLFIHADNFTRMDLSCLMEAHQRRPKHCVMTMLTFRTADPSSCGIVQLDKSGVVIGFHEKTASPPDNLANGAVYVLSADLLKELARLEWPLQDFSTEVIPMIMNRIYTYETKDLFVDIGTPATYDLVNSGHRLI